MRTRLAALAVLAVGCSPVIQALDGFKPASIATEEDAKRWAGMSAPAMYALSVAPAALRGLSDAGCPVVTTEGSTTKMSGGCTDSEGSSYSGSVTIVRSEPDAGTGTYTYEGWTIEGSARCSDGGTSTSKSVTQGSVRVTSSSAEAMQFTAEVRTDVTTADPSCNGGGGIVAWSYSGQMSRGAMGATTWKGSGRYGNTLYGGVQSETVDELIDSSVCSREALSGTTTVRAGSNVLVITYDGQSDCDESSTVKWSLNGAEKGELTGVSCHMAPASSALAFGLALLALRRRKRRN